METRFKLPLDRFSRVFKSYYVVWKQCTRRKSDYYRILFKSYYVVWKQNEAVEGKYIPLRLNRTM